MKYESCPKSRIQIGMNQLELMQSEIVNTKQWGMPYFF